MAKMHVASAAAGGQKIGIELALGLAVERLRQARNLTIDDLARLSRIPLPIVHAIESGEGGAQAVHVAALSTALGVRPAALLVYVMPG